MKNKSNRSFLGRLLIKWLVSALGLWIAAALLGDKIDYNDQAGVIIVSGLILALINMFIKPVIIFLSLPALLLTLGLFMIVINGLTVLLASALYEPLHVSSLWAAMLAGMVIGLINYLVVTILEETK